MVQKVGFFEISIENPLGPGGGSAHDCRSRGVPWVENIENFRLSRNVPKSYQMTFKGHGSGAWALFRSEKRFGCLCGVSRGHLVGFFDVCT